MRQNNLRYVRDKPLVYGCVIILFKSTQGGFYWLQRKSYRDCIMEFSLYVYTDTYETQL